MRDGERDMQVERGREGEKAECREREVETEGEREHTVVLIRHSH